MVIYAFTLTQSKGRGQGHVYFDSECIGKSTDVKTLLNADKIASTFHWHIYN